MDVPFSFRYKLQVLTAHNTSCIGQLKSSREPASPHSFLLTSVPKVLAITRATISKDLQAAVQKFYKQRITYQAAHKVLHTLQKRDIGLERSEFRKIPAYLEVLKEEDPTGHFVLSTDPSTEKCELLFISPSTCHETFHFCPRLVACDGTFTKSKFRQTLVFAVTIDGNNEAVVLAWALIESENEESWKFCPTKLKMYVYLSTSNWISTVNFFLTSIRAIPEI